MIEHRSRAAAAGTGLALAALLLSSCAGPQNAAAAYAVPPSTANVPSRSHAGVPAIELDASAAGPVVSADVYGGSLVTWFDYTQAFVKPSLRALGTHLVRYPGGSESDAYHWEHGGAVCQNQGYITKHASFDNLIDHVIVPLHFDTAVTLNYGSNPQCNGGGLPSEAGAWVAYSKAHGDAVEYWTVGNEVYGSWEFDLHAKKHDPATYADAVRTGYYPAVKAADPNAKLGVVVDTPNDTAWNAVVLSQAKPFDFVELHYYPQYDKDNDAFLLGTAVDNFVKDLAGLRAEMDEAGVAKSVPIYVGEYNADAGSEGKQSVSIVNGLFLGQMLGSFVNAGVPMATWWLDNGSCDQKGDFSKSLYGWQNFGSEAMLSDGLPNAYEGCATTPAIPGGTPFPTARVMALFDSTAPAGSTVRAVSVPHALGSSVRAYGFAVGSGYAVELFNNTLQSVSVDLRIKNAGRTSFVAAQTIYGKAQYDQSRTNRWVGPVSTPMGTVSSTISLTLQPYSLTAVTLK